MNGAARLELVPEPSALLAEPVILGGRYRLIRQLVDGGMGTVWYAEHLTLRSPVAVKLITPEGADNDDSLQRFLREARAGAALRSPHVVQIFDYGLHEGLPYIVMELLTGESLADRLNRTGPIGARLTAEVISQVARALTRAHAAEVIHRDLKPENIFLVDDDDDLLVKLLDFGIAKASMAFMAASAGKSTRTGMFLGTPRYASPEQIEGVKTLDHRTDIWSMGIVAYECLLGQPAFDADSIGKIMLEICTHPLPVPSEHGFVPPGFDEWFARACAHDPDQRFQTAREAARELARSCLTAPDEPSPSEQFAWQRPRNRQRTGVLAVTRRATTWAALALAGGITGFALAQRGHFTPAPSSVVLPQRVQVAPVPAPSEDESVPAPARVPPPSISADAPPPSVRQPLVAPDETFPPPPPPPATATTSPPAAETVSAVLTTPPAAVEPPRSHAATEVQKRPSRPGARSSRSSRGEREPAEARQLPAALPAVHAVPEPAKPPPPKPRAVKPPPRKLRPDELRDPVNPELVDLGI